MAAENPHWLLQNKLIQTISGQIQHRMWKLLSELYEGVFYDSLILHPEVQVLKSVLLTEIEYV